MNTNSCPNTEWVNRFSAEILGNVRFGMASEEYEPSATDLKYYAHAVECPECKKMALRFQMTETRRVRRAQWLDANGERIVVVFWVVVLAEVAYWFIARDLYVRDWTMYWYTQGICLFIALCAAGGRGSATNTSTDTGVRNDSTGSRGERRVDEGGDRQV